MFPSRHCKINTKAMNSGILVAVLLLIAALLTACGNQTGENLSGQSESDCDGQDSEVSQDVFADYDISDHLKQIYFDSIRRFEELFTPEDYIALCSVASNMSAEPSYAISKYVVSVHQNIATYNTSEDRYLVIDTSGNVVIDYGSNDSVDYNLNNIVFGKLIFFYTGSRSYDILDENGKVLNSIRYNQDPVYIADLSNGYYMFATIENINRSSYDLYILSPTGECHQIVDPDGYWNAKIDMDLSDVKSKYSLDAQIGNVSDGLVSVCYTRSVRGANETCAYYCDIYGNLVINLSSNEMNFHVTALGDFSRNQAEIEFTGADNRKYIATINQTGQFIEKPEPVT